MYTNYARVLHSCFSQSQMLKKKKKKMVKSLLKLARNILFIKEYYCQYCNLIELNKTTMMQHIKSNHDESGITIKLFFCVKCQINMSNNEIIEHIATH